MQVLELPPSESLNRNVRVESRYGTLSNAFLADDPLEAAARAEITLPSVESDLLMSAPSLSRVPVAPVELARSEPAKSTKLIRDTRSVLRFNSLS